MTINETFIIGDPSSGSGITFSSADNSVDIVLSGINVDLSVNTTDVLVSGGTAPISNGAVYDELLRKQNLPTGFITGLELSINPFDNTKVDIAAGAYSVTDYTDLFNIEVRIIQLPNGITGITPQYLTASTASYIALDADMNVIQSASPFDNADRRSLAIIGAAIHSNLTFVNITNEIKAPIVAPTNQLHDFIKAIGSLNLTGNIYGPNDDNLMIDKSAGQIWGLGINGGDYLDPHRLIISGQTALTFRYRLQDSTEYADTQLIDPNNYDLNGFLTPVPTGKFTIQHINLFQSGLSRVQYGQNLYDTMGDAKGLIQLENFQTEMNIAENSVFRAYLIIKEGTTGLTTSITNDEAEFIPVDKFGNVIGGAGFSLNYNDVITALGYVPENEANKTSVISGTSTTLYPNEKAVVDYVNSLPGQTENFNWVFNTVTTSGDPGNGRFRVNDTIISAVTEIYVDEFCDQTGLDIDTIFTAIDGSWEVYIQQTNDATKFARFSTEGQYINNTGWWTIPVTHIQSGTGGTLSNNAKCTFYLINKNSGVSTDIYTTGVTLSNNVLYFDRTDTMSAYTVDLSSLSAATPSLQEVIDVNEESDKILLRTPWSARTNGGTYAAAVDTNGDVFLYGDFTTYNGVTSNRIVKLDNEGNKDVIFDTGTGTNGTIYTPVNIVKTNDGLYIASEFTVYNGTPINRIARIKMDGTLDPAFNVGSGFGTYTTGVYIDPLGQIYVTGRLGTYQGIPTTPGGLPCGIIRLNTDGSKDTTFNLTGGTDNIFTNGVTFIPSSNKMYISHYGNVYNGNPSGGISRFNYDGSTDFTFSSLAGGIQPRNGTPSNVVLDSLERLYIYGYITSYNGISTNYLARVNTDGSIDNTFGGGTRFNNILNAVLVLPDDRILVGGTFTTYNGATANRICRLNTDGTLDNTFNAGGVAFSGAGSYVEAIYSMPDGSFIVIGGFSSYNGVPMNNVLRMTPNGDIISNRDLTFVDGRATYNITDLDMTTSSEILPKTLIEELIATYEHTSPLGTLSIDSTIPNNVKFDLSSGTTADINSRESLSNKVDTLLSGTSDNYPSVTALDNVRVGSFGITIDGGGVPIMNGIKGFVTIPYSCVITGWDVIADATGSCVIDVWRSSSIPNVGNSITGTEKPTLTNEQIHRDDTLTTWDTVVNENDIIAFNLESSSDVNRITLIIKTIKN